MCMALLLHIFTTKYPAMRLLIYCFRCYRCNSAADICMKMSVANNAAVDSKNWPNWSKWLLTQQHNFLFFAMFFSWICCCQEYKFQFMLFQIVFRWRFCKVFLILFFYVKIYCEKLNFWVGFGLWTSWFAFRLIFVLGWKRTDINRMDDNMDSLAPVTLLWLM